ncbi:GntR family transcriptional regulator [Rhizobacter sp. Root1221]|uniref:GntR family transcriptional regulator n=1 Tax=Rhizobacter sp. Root1221 TaxID=1736433 RepID=UPI0006FCAFC6|nr:GntR family transcriptional regulator [Rhizobacter sp. Root1221]KQW01582.1 GntR family transcriptional regulator [Rhizobacter sp. Root1221]
MKSSAPLATQVLDLLAQDRLAVGSHLAAQTLADRLGVSRSPVNEALRLLQAKGLLTREPNRGYFVAQPIAPAAEAVRGELERDGPDVVTRSYFQLADDRLRGEVPDTFSEVWLKNRYGLTPAQVTAVLGRMAQEGWVQKKAGYGWSFSPMLTTPDSLLQSYRLRLALEPAALLEPGYRLDPDLLARCRAAEHHLLAGGIDTDTADQLHTRGVRFHEAIVEGSGNPFFIETLRRVNRVRRLLSYRSMKDRQRYEQHCAEHLHVLDLIEQHRLQDAAETLRVHLGHTLDNLGRLRGLLTP